MSNGARKRIQLWIYAIALFALTATLTLQGHAGTTGAAAALILITTVLISLALTGAGNFATIARQRATVKERARRIPANGQHDPDAAGSVRPRAPGRFPSH